MEAPPLPLPPSTAPARRAERHRLGTLPASPAGGADGRGGMGREAQSRASTPAQARAGAPAGAGGKARARQRLWGVPALAGAAGIAASLATQDGAGGVLGAALAVVVVAIAAIDARRFLIPDGLNALGVGLGLAHAALAAAPGETLSAVALAGLRGAVTALAFLALREAYFRLRGREGLGLGDVKLAAVAGVWLDWTTIPLVIDMAALAALVAISLRGLVTGRTLQATGRLPFGLFFAPAIFIGWLGERWLAAGLWGGAG